MHCPFCGAFVERGARFCGSCGNDVSPYTGARVKQSAQTGSRANAADLPAFEGKKKSNRGLIIALCSIIALGVVAIAVFGTMMLLKNNSQPEELASDPTASDTTVLEPTQPSEQPTQAPSETAAPTETETEAPNVTANPGATGIDADTQYKLNLFLSNFSESFFGDWEAGNSRYATFDRLMFVFSWFNLNKHDQMKFSADYDAMLSYEQVNERLERFFGEGISRPSEGTRYTSEYGARIYFENGYFTTPWGEGDSHADFTVAKSMKDNGDGTYTVEFDVYTAEDYATGGDHLTDESFYKLTPENVTGRNVTYQYSGHAIVRPYKNGSIDSYQLEAYFRD